MLWAPLVDSLSQCRLLLGGEEANPRIIFQPMFHQTGRIVFRLAILHREPVSEAQECTEPVARRGRPFLLCESPFDILGRDRISWIITKPLEKGFHSSDIMPVIPLVGLRVG